MKKLSPQRGAALVEFAVVAPVAIAVLFAIIEMGLLVYSWHTVGNAASLGARWAMTRGGKCLNTSVCPATAAEIRSYVRTEVPGLHASSVTVTPHWYTDSTGATDCSTDQDIGCVVKVDVSYPFRFSIPFVGNKSITLTGTSEMTITD